MYHVRMWAGYGTNGYSVQLWADIDKECPTFLQIESATHSYARACRNKMKQSNKIVKMKLFKFTDEKENDSPEQRTQKL